MYTVDATVHVSALNCAEASSPESQAFLALVSQKQLPLYSPALLLVAVAAAVARVLGDPVRARALADGLRGLPDQTLVPLDEGLAARAAGLASTARLRGADAVYAAVAQQAGATLVTLDGGQLARLPAVVQAVRPGELLRELGVGRIWAARGQALPVGEKATGRCATWSMPHVARRQIHWREVGHGTTAQNAPRAGDCSTSSLWRRCAWQTSYHRKPEFTPRSDPGPAPASR